MTFKQFFIGRTVGLIIILVIAALVAGMYSFKSSINTQDNYMNIEYKVQGEQVKLGGAVTYFGNEIRTDLNDDGREDILFLITQQPGGSGTFYYAVAALNTEKGYVGSEAIFLGDRIAPQSTEKGKGRIVIVNYADRAFGESFAVKPSIGKSIWLLLDPKTMQFGEVAQNFEGESD